MMDMKDRNWTLPVSYLKVFLQYASTREIAVDALLEDTGLDTQSLLSNEKRVRFQDMRRVLNRVTRLLGPGWHLGLADRLTVSAHGALGFAVVTAPDIRASLDVLLRFFGVRGPFLWSAGSLEGDQFVIRFFEALEMGTERRLLVELALLSVQSLIERPLGRAIQNARISLAYPAPEYREQLEQSFHARVSYGARRHFLRIPAAWLDEPCAMQDEAMHRFLLAQCREELRLAAGALPAEVAVRQALLSRPGEMPGLAEIAAAQHISPRTLIRRLKRGRTSYQEIINDVRRTLAADYLLNSGLSVSRIAYRLGYQDPSNFGRAFRGWFGVSPGVYRANQAQPSNPSESILAS
jgi:AraC-like DNA-binding protein